MNAPESQHPHIGHNIKMLRELRNYTQEYMAQCIGISRQSYCKLEHSADINTAQLYQIAKALDTDVFHILAFNDQQIF